jgi:succinyl-diaminopimelate desuccinylase
MSRDVLAAAARREAGGVVEIARRLLAIPSAYPPGDTNAVAEELAALMDGVPGIEIGRHRSAVHLLNIVIRVCGRAPGRRVVFNGHLDTFPRDPAARWTADPAGELRDGRLYGLGVSDMKGGVAASLFALRLLAAHRKEFRGEVIGTFAGDEESMGAPCWWTPIQCFTGCAINLWRWQLGTQCRPCIKPVNTWQPVVS